MRNMTKKWEVIIFLAIISSCDLLFGGAIFAQEKYPTKPITMVVSWAAGGGQDMVARAIEPNFVKAIGQPAVITNKPGGGATIGFSEIMNASPDGYTIGAASPSLMTSQHTIKGVTIDYRNFEPIIYVANAPMIVIASKNAPWNNLKEICDWVKNNPGKLRVGNSGYGGSTHLTAIAMEKAFQSKVIHVPYKGGAPSIPALMGGHLDVIVNSLGDVLHLIKGGELKALGVASEERDKFIPEAQTFRELGMDVLFGAYYTWIGPKGIPKDRIDSLYQAFRKSAESKEFIQFCDQQGISIKIKGPEEFAKFLAEDDTRWKEVIEIGGIKPQ
jgi:tripartite-type tricarboxylate transporter receptor subunit TctC